MAAVLSTPLDNPFNLSATAMARHFDQYGIRDVLAVTNILDALPGRAAQALEQGHMSPTAYAGRTPWMLLGDQIQIPLTILTHGEMNPVELDLLGWAYSRLHTSMPTLTKDASISPHTFLYPFIATPHLATQYGKRTFKGHRACNRKSDMRKVLKGMNSHCFIVPGTEVTFQGESLTRFVEKIYTALRQYAMNSDANTLVVKVTDSASGLGSWMLTPWQTDELRRRVNEEAHKNQLRQLFLAEGQEFLDDAVIEEGITDSPDFSIRGFVGPNGNFIPYSFARQITLYGEYLGGIVMPANSEHVRQIGLAPAVRNREIDVMRQLTQRLWDLYEVWGHMNFDFFGKNCYPLNRDPNWRLGGSHIAAILTNFAPVFFGCETAVMDLELKFITSTRLTEEDITQLLEHVLVKGSWFYASNFLNHPKQTADGLVYTLKTVTPTSTHVVYDWQMIELVQSLVHTLNEGLNLSHVRFVSPLN